MYLIGEMEMKAENGDEIFAPVGEDSFNEVVSKKLMARRMKAVKGEMIKSLMDESSGAKVKVPTNMVRAVTLLLLQPGLLGMVGNNETTEEEMKVDYISHLWYLQWFCVYSMFIFILGMYVGYKYRIRLSILVRTAVRFFRQEITMEMQRQNDERMFREGILQEVREQEVRERRSGRDLLLRAQMWSAAGGEWRYEGRTTFPDNPLQPAEPDRQLQVELQNEPRTEPSESQERDDDYEWMGEWTTDWDPVLQRMREYRILEGSEDAESGEEYFTGNETTGLYRRYRPTRSERETPQSGTEQENPIMEESQNMDVDMEANDGRTYPGGVWSDYDRREPPNDANWDDLETIYKYLPPDEERRGRKGQEAGIFPVNLLKEFLQARISQIHGRNDPRSAFDHVLKWNADEKRDFANFAIMVMSGQWEINWDEHVRRYFDEGVA